MRTKPLDEGEKKNIVFNGNDLFLLRLIVTVIFLFWDSIVVVFFPAILLVNIFFFLNFGTRFVCSFLAWYFLSIIKPSLRAALRIQTSGFPGNFPGFRRQI